MPKKAIWVQSHLRDGGTVKGHVRLVDYEPKSKIDATLNVAKRVGLRVRSLANEEEPGLKAAEVAFDEWVALRSAVKNKLRYTRKADEVFSKNDGLPVESIISVPTGVATAADTAMDLASVGALNVGSLGSAGLLGFAVAFLPVATHFNDRIADYDGKNSALLLLKKCFKPYTGENWLRKKINQPAVARSIVTLGVGGLGTGLALAMGSPLAALIAGLTVLEGFHEHAIAADAKNKIDQRDWGKARKWINNPRTAPRIIAAGSPAVTAATLGALSLTSGPIIIAGVALGGYQLQKWLQRVQENKKEQPPERQAAKNRPPVLTA
jgi:hypothetical protein